MESIALISVALIVITLFVTRRILRKSDDSQKSTFLTAKSLSLEEIEELKKLEKKDFDRRLRIALDSNDIVDAEFEEIEENRKSTNAYLDRYSKAKR